MKPATKPFYITLHTDSFQFGSIIALNAHTPGMRVLCKRYKTAGEVEYKVSFVSKYPLRGSFLFNLKFMLLKFWYVTIWKKLDEWFSSIRLYRELVGYNWVKVMHVTHGRDVYYWWRRGNAPSPGESIVYTEYHVKNKTPNTMSKSKPKIDTTLALIIGVGLIFLIGICIFLFGKSSPNGVTGWQVLGMQGSGFWFWIVFCTAAAGVLIWRLILNENQGGSSGKTWALAVFAILLVTTPWGRACTDKANDGITAPKYQKK